MCVYVCVYLCGDYLVGLVLENLVCGGFVRDEVFGVGFERGLFEWDI